MQYSKVLIFTFAVIRHECTILQRLTFQMSLMLHTKVDLVPVVRGNPNAFKPTSSKHQDLISMLSIFKTNNLQVPPWTLSGRYRDGHSHLITGTTAEKSMFFHH